MAEQQRERDIAEMEAQMAHDTDQYFEARPQIMRTRDKETTFEAGFKAAWAARPLSHAEGEAVDHWAVRNPGLADQFRAEAQAVRKRLGFESDADDVSPNDLRERIAEIEGAPQVADTPSAKWRENGEADPHGESYNGPRSALPMGTITDDELANGVFMHGSTGGGDHSSIAWLTAAKERIRWLSRRAVAAPQVAGLTETAIKSSPAYRALHREKEHLLGLLKDQAPQVAVPEGWEIWTDDHGDLRVSGTAERLPTGRQHRETVWLGPEPETPELWLFRKLCDRLLAAAPTAPAGEPECCRSQPCKRPGTGPCEMPAVQKPVSDPDGLEQVLDDLRKLHTEMTNADLVHEGSPEIVGYCVTGKQLDRLDWLLTCAVSAGLNSAPAPDEREIAAKALERHADNLIVMAERDGRNSDRESHQTWEEAAYFAKQEADRLRAGQEGE